MNLKSGMKEAKLCFARPFPFLSLFCFYCCPLPPSLTQVFGTLCIPDSVVCFHQLLILDLLDLPYHPEA
jgi:hypothetical protein